MFNVIYGQNTTLLSKELQTLQPENAFPDDGDKTFQFRDISNVDKKAIFETIRQSSTTVYSAEVFSTAKSHYDVNVKWYLNKSIKKGDVILARLTLRANYAKQESGEAVVSFYVTRKDYGGDKNIIVQLGAGPEWKTFDVPFVALTDMPIGEGKVYLSFGALPQKVEVKDIAVYNFNNKIELNQLPTTRFSYFGREETANWRKEALKRIDEIRTAPIQIQITNSKGAPVQGAKVDVAMKKSDFVWGTAVNEAILANELPDSKKYKEYLLDFFNTAVIENGFKGGSWKQSETGQSNTINAFHWLEKSGLRQRGHNLVWPAWKFNPSSLKKLALSDSQAFESYIDNEIREKTTFLKGKVIGWDVINELVHEKDFFPYLPKDIAVKWFQTAKSIDPDAQLFINEYGMLNSIASPKNIEEYISIIKELKSKGAPIDAIGIQGHVGRQPRNPQQVISDLELFQPIGLPVQITEFDINMKDEELQADYTRDFLIACYSSPVITGFTIWGFWESKHWKPDAAMFKKDWTPKPNARVWQDLITKQWKTTFSRESDKSGIVTGKGHLGWYELTITKGDIVHKQMFHLEKGGNPLVVKL